MSKGSKFRYPMAGDLQKLTAVELAGNPRPSLDDRVEVQEGGRSRRGRIANVRSGFVDVVLDGTKKSRTFEERDIRILPAIDNPIEVRSRDGGLEGEFARQDDAEAYADELRRIGAKGVVVQHRSRLHPHAAGALRRRNPEETCDLTILDGMARALWLMAYADHVENLSPSEREAGGFPVRLSGITWDNVAPPTPDSAVDAARDLYLLIDRANGEKTVGQLYDQACFVDKIRPTEELARVFGHYLAMQATGEGVSWFDSHKEFPLKFPREFEVHYDDGEVWWSPQVRSRQNPPQKWVVDYFDSDGTLLQTQFFSSEASARKYADQIRARGFGVDVHKLGGRTR